MRRLIGRGAVAALLFSASAVAGCQTTGAKSHNISWAGSNAALVLFNAPAFKDTSSRHVVFTDTWQHEEYVLFEGDGVQAEIIFAVANETDNIALDYNLPVQPMVQTWNIARSNTVTWGANGRARATLGTYFYKRFQVKQRNCFGFYTEWDQKQDDPQLRDSKVVFGYYCDRSESRVSDAQLVGLLDAIDIRDVTARYGARFSPVAPSGPESKQAGAAAFAQLGDGDRGNANFPFDLADMYPTAEGGLRR